MLAAFEYFAVPSLGLGEAAFRARHFLLNSRSRPPYFVVCALKQLREREFDMCCDAVYLLETISPSLLEEWSQDISWSQTVASGTVATVRNSSGFGAAAKSPRKSACE